MFHTLHKEKAKNKDGEYKHKSAVIRYIFRNKTKAKEYLQRLNLGGLLGRNDFDKMFSISGSLIVTNIELLDNQTKEFLKNKGGRFFIRRYDTHSEYHLRGPRYIVALDPHYSVIQKLDYY